MAISIPARNGRSSGHALLGGVLVVVTTVAVAKAPAVLFIPFGAALLYAMATRPWARLVVVVGGGLVIFQSPSGGQRLLYVAAAFVCVAVALLRMPKIMNRHAEIAAFKPMLVGSAVLLAMCMASLPVALHNGASTNGWLTAVLPYLLLAILPVVGLEAAASTPRTVTTIITLVAMIAPLAFMTDWLHRRGVSSLGFGRFAFGSIPLCALALGVGLGRLADQRSSRISWALLSVYAPLAVLLTGTRSAIALLGGVLGAIGATRKVRLPIWKALLAAAGLALALFYLVPVIGPHLTDQPGFYQQRFASLSTLWHQGAGSLASDQSYQGRAYGTELALDGFHAHPGLGIGPGSPVDLAGDITTLDTPYASLLRFGIMGVFGLGIYVIGWYLAVRALRIRAGYSWALTGASVFTIAMLCYLPLSALFDDKGLALAVCLWAAAVPSAAIQASNREDSVSRDECEAGPM